VGETANPWRACPLQDRRAVTYQNLRDRTFKFALAIVQFCRQLPATWEARRIAAQLCDCGTSVGANYRASGRARSDSEFIARIGTVVEEADEAEFWLDLLKQADIDHGPQRDTLATEAQELRAIFVASRATAIRNREKKRQRRADVRKQDGPQK
jgi:four helix bundle protein